MNGASGVSVRRAISTKEYDVAQVCHEANRAYCATLGDLSQPPWGDAPEWQRESAINGVILHVDNPDLPASASHESWMREKLEAGWAYGPVKHPEIKQHPCLLPFDELAPEQQAKDRLFIAVVRALTQ